MMPISIPERLPTPIWLTDIDYPAPCPCGEGLMHGDQMVLVQNENGLKRLMHLRCVPGIGMLDVEQDG